jgi:hypothetical protein
VIKLVEEAAGNQCQHAPACAARGVSLRTYQRGTKEGDGKADGRKGNRRTVPSNKLSEDER